jgi:hypothetical protein
MSTYAVIDPRSELLWAPTDAWTWKWETAGKANGPDAQAFLQDARDTFGADRLELVTEDRWRDIQGEPTTLKPGDIVSGDGERWVYAVSNAHSREYGSDRLLVCLSDPSQRFVVLYHGADELLDYVKGRGFEHTGRSTEDIQWSDK